MSGTRILLIAALALAMLLGVIFVAFFPEDDPNDGTAPILPDGGKKTPVSGDGHQPLSNGSDALAFLSWPRPKAAFILTGEQHGYIEPCGCTENQSGGLSRRADMFRKLKEKEWDVAGLDVGGLLKRARLQSEVKFNTTLLALKDLNYKAIGLGPEEVRVRDTLIAEHDLESQEAINFLCCNVVFYDDPELGTPARSKVFEHGGLKIGVTAVLGLSHKPQLTQVADFEMTNPAEALKPVYETLKAQGLDLRILMVHGTAGEVSECLKACPDFDLVLSSAGPEDPLPEPNFVGRTMVLDVGHKGKYVGVLGVYPDQEPRFRFDLVELRRDRFGDSDPMIAHMRRYQDRLLAERVAVAEPPVGHPSGAGFVGSQACAECHEEEYDIWKETGHGSAFASLDPANKRHGYERLKGVVRMYDPECIACHVTGWNPQEVYRYRTGFINTSFAGSDAEKKMSGLLMHSGCENCHGPGSRHIELANEGEDELAAKQMRLTLEQANSASGCYKCHDLDNSPNFKFDEYWEKIAH